MKHFVLGNGESRLQLDLQALKQTGRIYGCNALYRDFEPDAIIVVDGGMMHEIGASGYIYNHLCYFRTWTRLPEYAYDSLVKDVFYEDWHDEFKSENPKMHFNEFVMNGTDPNQILRLYEKIKENYEEANLPFDDEDIKQKLGKHHQWITWVDEKDQVLLIPDEFSGWSAGPIAVRLMKRDYDPDEIFLIGFDMNSIDGMVNNVYKGTSNYVPENTSEIHSGNWKVQHAQNFLAYPDTVFYHVSSDAEEIEDWYGHQNVDYLNFGDLELKLDTSIIL